MNREEILASEDLAYRSSYTERTRNIAWAGVCACGQTALSGTFAVGVWCGRGGIFGRGG